MVNTAPLVVLVGAANLDILGFSADPLIPRDSNPGHIRLCAGGVSRNVAENLARLGIRTELVTAVGSGLDGTFILESCRRAGIGIRHVLELPTMSSGYIAMMDHDGDMAMALSDMSISDHITADYLREKADLLLSADIIAADTCLPPETLEHIVTEYPGKITCIDPVSVSKGKRLIPIVGRIHTLKMNRLEAEAISGLTIGSREDLERIGTHFLTKGTKRVFITLGADGLFWCTPGASGYHRSKYVSPISTTGAGDACMAGIVYASLNNYGTDETVRFSAAMAALALSGEDTVNPDLSLDAVRGYMEE